MRKRIPSLTACVAALVLGEAAGAKPLSTRFEAADRSSIMLEFPGGYVAEIHALKGR